MSDSEELGRLRREVAELRRRSAYTTALACGVAVIALFSVVQYFVEHAELRAAKREEAKQATVTVSSF